MQDCHIHDNAGHGVHSGSCTVRYVLADNHIHNNGDCGIYNCLRTTHSTCRDNRIETNANHGITVGERDTHHLITRNTIGGNGKAGLIFRKPVMESGNHVIVRDNHFKARHVTADCAGSSETNHLAIKVSAGLHDVHLIGNVFEESGTRYFRAPGLHERHDYRPCPDQPAGTALSFTTADSIDFTNTSPAVALACACKSSPRLTTGIAPPCCLQTMKTNAPGRQRRMCLVRDRQRV